MITVTKLHKSFPMGEHTLPVLKGIDLTIARGELIAVVGTKRHAGAWNSGAWRNS